MNVQVNGVILYYEKQGSGPPLVLLHGNGEDGRIFDRTAEVLAPHYTVYTIDSRCHGKSSRNVPLSYDLMAGFPAHQVTKRHTGRRNCPVR